MTFSRTKRASEVKWKMFFLVLQVLSFTLKKQASKIQQTKPISHLTFCETNKLLYENISMQRILTVVCISKIFYIKGLFYTKRLFSNFLSKISTKTLSLKISQKPAFMKKSTVFWGFQKEWKLINWIKLTYHWKRNLDLILE